MSVYQTLTKREQEIWDGVADGLMNKQIAHRIGISEHSTRIYASQLIKKVGAQNRTTLAIMHPRYEGCNPNVA